MSESQALTRRAGSAVRWRMAHLVGVNSIFMLRVIVLARMLDPDSFGLYAIGMVSIGILLQATEFGMVPALVHADAPTRRHYDVAWTISCSRGLMTAVSVFLAAPWIASLAGEPRAVDITRALALHPFLFAISSIRLADLQRQLDFKPLAVLHLGEAVVNTIVSIALAPMFGVWALVFGTLGGSFGRLVISYVVAPYAPRIRFESAASKALISFGRWVFVGALLTTVGDAVLRLLISRRLGAADLGIYYLATRLTFMLVGAVIDVGTSVSFPIYARLQEERQEAVRVFRSVLSATTALVVPLFAILAALAPTLVADVLGPQWQGAAEVLRVLALVCILTTLGDVTMPIWQGMGQPWRNALIEGLQFAVLLPAIWWATARLGVVGAALAWLPAVGLSQLISAWFLPSVLPRPFEGILGGVLAIFASAAAASALAMLVDQQLDGAPGAVAGGVAGALLCGLLLWLLDRSLDLGLRRSLVRVFPRLEGVI